VPHTRQVDVEGVLPGLRAELPGGCPGVDAVGDDDVEATRFGHTGIDGRGECV
jgi:hypothetical protein